jgi:hypothetical protein
MHLGSVEIGSVPDSLRKTSIVSWRRQMTVGLSWVKNMKSGEVLLFFFFSGETWGLNDLHLYTIVRVWSWPSDIIWTISGEFLSVPWCDFLSHRSYTLRGWTNRCFWEKGQIAVFKGISSNGYLRPSWSAPKLLRDSEVPRPGGH